MGIFNVDWFDRDTNFTSSNKDIKSGWEVGVGSKYCSYLYNYSDILRFLSNDNSLVEEFLSLASSLNIKVNVKIDSEGETSMTDGKNIVISKKFNPEIEDDYDCMDILFGLFFHESAHCIYTDFDSCKTDKKVLKYIHNIIEDEMIETKLGIKYPGYINFIYKVKYYFFDRVSELVSLKGNINSLDEILKLFLFTVRYPKYINSIDSDILSKYEDLFSDIYNILKKNYCLDFKSHRANTKCSFDASLEIYNLLKDKINEEDDFEKQESELEGNSDSIINIYEDSINTSCTSSSEINDEEKREEYEDEIVSIVTVEEDNELGEPFESNSINKNRYYQYYTKISKYINQARNIIINNSYKEKFITEINKRNGTLNTNKLVEAIQGVNTVYKRNSIISVRDSSPKYAFVLVLDESGSMFYYHDLLSELAILLYEALSTYPEIELYIYGHGDFITKYITKYNKDKYVLGDRKKQTGQNEYRAYKYIIDDVSKQTKLPKVILSITDCNYVTDNTDFGNLILENKKKNTYFNLISIGESKNDINYTLNDKMYGKDGWIAFPSSVNMNELIEKTISMVRRNYFKFN